ncbi:DUF1499 domain-containing protein [Haliea sp. E1-2-M8]|uniref:DUF1499 domain-containing protein n=1 Tax=Haliea sp. E1-2-M8 TaxID=3064706 RepID=UPI002724BA56|nr:DUF1499 domain-containing protein [Haliea sp. E1-2-M8]MDO8862227.1 DUF1499 domain-containing protein [Haliea sp. E1-2-M8]
MQQSPGSSRLLTVLTYLALALLLALPLAVLMVRAGLWQQGLMLYAISCLAAAVVLLLLVLLLALPRYRQRSRQIWLGAALVLPGTLLFLSVLATRGYYPPIHDITTDLSDPPVFTHATTLRGPDSNTLAVKPDTLGVQREAYPDLESLRSERSASNAYRHALEVAAGLGWDIVWQDPESAYIEAVDTTAIMAFKDDIAIRVRSTAEGSVIDLRSVSRVGVGDIGANAKRIRAFIAAFKQEGT